MAPRILKLSGNIQNGIISKTKKFQGLYNRLKKVINKNLQALIMVAKWEPCYNGPFLHYSTIFSLTWNLKTFLLWWPFKC